ncbi:MAG: methyltransferase domain-containing protein [Burkholderiales bacterium]
MASDSAEPQFWDTRYREGVTPWDAGRVPPRLLDWLTHEPAGRRVLVPGCGSAYEVRLFAERGDDVIGIDFSDAALDAARRSLGELAHRVRKADFFDFAARPFDLVYERTFMCALPPRERPRWASQLARLVRSEGLVAGFFFLADKERGPPFGIAMRELRLLLEPAFALIEDESVPAEQSVNVLAGHERWQVWKRQL